MSRPEDVIWEFGSFRLDTAQRLLFRDGKLVPLSRKAVEILVFLVARQGQLVEKEELMQTVWPDAFVEESNLAVHISQLRKTLGADDGYRIETIPRRGYRFVGMVHRVESEPKPLNVASEASSVVPIQGSKESLNSPAATSTAPEVQEKRPAMSKLWTFAGVGAVLVLSLVFLAVRFRAERLSKKEDQGPHPEAKHAIVLGQIANNTGEPVFDITLHDAIATELEQSPYLTLIPEARLQQSMKLMGKAPDAPMTPELGRDLCQRNDGQAVIDGWIAKLGTQYVIGVRAV